MERTYAREINQCVSFPWLLYNRNDNRMNGICQRAEHSVDAYIERYARESKCRYYCMGTAKGIRVSTKSNGANKVVIIGEGLGGLVGGALGGAMVSLVTLFPLSIYYEKEDAEWGALKAMSVALPVGYLIGVPLFSTSGVATVGNMHHQNGSIKGSMMGSAIGTIAGVGGILIAVGGNSSPYTYVSDERLYVYSESSGWDTKADMQVPRYNLVCAEATGKIYAIGGTGDDQYSATCVEAYNPYTNSWEQDQNHGGYIEPMPFPLAISSCVSVNGKIYVIGGLKLEQTVSCPGAWTSYRAIVLEYDAPYNEWNWKTSIQSERSGLAVTMSPTFKSQVPRGQSVPAIMGYTIYVIGGAAKIPVTPYVEVANIGIEMSPWAFGLHNGQILEIDSSNRTHFVYNGNDGWIYYTCSNDGYSYRNPIKLGEGTNPNIALDSKDNIHIVWFTNNSFYYKRFDANSEKWAESILLVSTKPLEYPEFGAPSIATSQDSLFVIWESKQKDSESKGKALLFGSANLKDVGSTFHYLKIDEGSPKQTTCKCQQPPVTTPDKILRSPSIDVDVMGNPYIAWDKVHPYKDILFYERENGKWTSTILSDTSICTQEMEPNIKVENGVINVVWTGEYDPCEPTDIYYRKGYVKGGWEPVRKVCSTDKDSRSPVWLDGYVLWEEDGDIYRNRYDYSIFEFKSKSGENLTDFSGIQQDATFSKPHIVTIDKNVFEFFLMDDSSGTYMCLNAETMKAVPPLYAINCGLPEPSPYTIERDDYVTYGENFFESLDIDTTKLKYHFDGIKPGPQKMIEFVFYHEGEKDLKLIIKIDDQKIDNICVPPGKPISHKVMIPESCLKDGKIDLTIEPVSPKDNDIVVCNAIWIFDLSSGNGGTQFDGEGEKSLPAIYSLRNSYPDPFNNRTTIFYSLAKPGKVSLKVYDVSGRLVKTLVNKEQSQGVYNIRWNGTNNNNRRVGSGVYFYRLQSRQYTSVKKVVCVR